MRYSKKDVKLTNILGDITTSEGYEDIVGTLITVAKNLAGA